MNTIEYLFWKCRSGAEQIEAIVDPYDEYVMYGMITIIVFFVLGGVVSARWPEARRLLSSKWQAILRIIGALALLALLYFLVGCQHLDGNPRQLVGGDNQDIFIADTSSDYQGVMQIMRPHECFETKPPWPVNESTGLRHSINCYIWSSSPSAPLPPG